MRCMRCMLPLFLLLCLLIALVLYLNAPQNADSSASSSTSIISHAHDANWQPYMVLDLYDEDIRKLPQAQNIHEQNNAEVHVYAIRDLRRLRQSLFEEVKTFVSRREKLFNEIENATAHLQMLLDSVQKTELQLSSLQNSLAQLRLIQREELERNAPEVLLPLSLSLNDRPLIAISTDSATTCSSLHACFDYSRCSITRPFSIFVYPAPRLNDVFNSNDLRDYTVTDQSQACISIKVWTSTDDEKFQLMPNTIIVVNRASRVPETIRQRAIIAAEDFQDVRFRPAFDVLLPPVHIDAEQLLRDNVWTIQPVLVPIIRPILASMHYMPSVEKDNIQCTKLIDSFASSLNVLNATKQDVFHLPALDCHNRNICSPVLKHNQSIFTLIPLCNCGLSTCTSREFVEALRHGSIPVLIGSNPTNAFPFATDDFINWRRFALHTSLQRVTELNYLLKSIPPVQLLEMKRQARLFYSTYFGTYDAIISTLMHTIRQRLQLPPRVASKVYMRAVFGDNFESHPPKTAIMPPLTDPDEILGPLEPPLASLAYQHNTTLVHTYSGDAWNSWPLSIRLLTPQLPYAELPVPIDAQYTKATSFGFRPIEPSSYGAGHDFTRALGGDHLREQFTGKLILLFYDRVTALVQSLQFLERLPYLNRVIVVCNNEHSMQMLHDITFPRLHVPVHFVTNGKNSLNNRFLPNALIETEAVLSLDDDVAMMHEEIILAFRIWRENRDRIVGLPARFHTYSDGGYTYRNNHTCQYSLVLTGAAFLHQYYFYEYTYNMPSAIRAKVDELMNCEDLAMNFLVAHLTRKPPIKVTSKWTFRCPTCPETLSEQEQHYTKRNYCMNYFARIYGYNPLLHSQYRADSVLFKTRLPPQHQKCFRYV